MLKLDTAMTLSEEDYIKAIYHLGMVSNKTVSTNAVADQMETKPSSVTDMVKKLSDKGLVNYKRYKGVSLTELGKKTALSIVRKHRLWEVFLVEKLNFSWDEVHDKLVDRLDKHLGYPQVDPHGDPIPSKKGEFKKTVKKLLNEVPLRTSGICVGVKDSSPPFLKFLDKNKIALGDTITVVDKEEFDGSLHIQIKGSDLHISNLIATNLYLKITE